jgi:excisionase family DNA binding protein
MPSKPVNPLPKLLASIPQVQESLSCSRSKVVRMIKAGDLDAVKIGPKNIRVTVESVMRYVERIARKEGSQKDNT